MVDFPQYDITTTIQLGNPMEPHQGGLGVTSEALRAGVPVITSGILCCGEPSVKLCKS